MWCLPESWVSSFVVGSHSYFLIEAPPRPTSSLIQALGALRADTFQRYIISIRILTLTLTAFRSEWSQIEPDCFSNGLCPFPLPGHHELNNV